MSPNYKGNIKFRIRSPTINSRRSINDSDRPFYLCLCVGPQDAQHLFRFLGNNHSVIYDVNLLAVLSRLDCWMKTLFAVEDLAQVYNKKLYEYACSIIFIIKLTRNT